MIEACIGKKGVGDPRAFLICISSGVMGHLVSTSKKAGVIFWALLCEAEKTKSLLAVEGLLQICQI